MNSRFLEKTGKSKEILAVRIFHEVGGYSQTSNSITFLASKMFGKFKNVEPRKIIPAKFYKIKNSEMMIFSNPEK